MQYGLVNGHALEFSESEVGKAARDAKVCDHILDGDGSVGVVGYVFAGPLHHEKSGREHLCRFAFDDSEARGTYDGFTRGDCFPLAKQIDELLGGNASFADIIRGDA